MSEDEWGVPVMDLSKAISSDASCSEVEGCAGDVGKVIRGPCKKPPTRNKPKVIRAKELLRVLRRFHRDHVKHVTSNRDGFLGYHAMNPRLRSSRPAQKTILDGHFDEMGFVYDSVLSKDYGRSCILELVSVDFNARKSGTSSGVKRSLSLDDLDMMAQKNDQLDKRMLMLFGGDEDKRVGLKVLCDGCYNMERLKCQFARCTTILQDDRVVRKITFIKDGKESINQESISYPRYYINDSLKMVDEYYSIQYAEGLFKRCNMEEIWKSLDFVHKKWLGEIIDYEYILMSNCLKSIPKRENSKESVSLYSDGLSRASTMLISTESELYNSSTGSLNNVLVDGMPLYNETVNNSSISKKCDKPNNEAGVTKSNLRDSRCEPKSTRKLKANANNLIAKMKRYRVKSKAKNIGLLLPNYQRKIATRNKSSRSLSEKRHKAKRIVCKDLENDSESSEKTEVWKKNRGDLSGGWNSSMISDVSDNLSNSGLIVDEEANRHAKVGWAGKRRERYCDECSESSSSCSGYSGPFMKSKMTSTRDDELVVTCTKKGNKVTLTKPSRIR